MGDLDRLNPVLAILAATLLCSCGGDSGDSGDAQPLKQATVRLPAEFVIGFGETIYVGEAVSLEFTTLVEDSRCPVSVHCTWPGNGRVLLRTETPRIAEVVELNTNLQFPDIAQFDADNYKVQLRKLEPLPVAGTPSGSVSIPVSSYEITVYVERIVYHNPTGP
jgi:hypothetical protein